MSATYKESDYPKLGNGRCRSVFGSAHRRFWEKVIQGENGCWNWTGEFINGGYGRMRIHNKRVIAHRYAYEEIKGAIPDGLVLDHLCRNRRCVNPKHLEPVTMRENILRGVGHCAKNAMKTHCPSGHEYTPDNTYYSQGKRSCKACSVRHAATYRSKNYYSRKLKKWLPRLERPDAQ